MNIKYQIVKPQAINTQLWQEMFMLMDFHYANTFPDVFNRDLKSKSDVIMLFDSNSNELVGFSTQRIFPFRSGEEEILVLYSGDTIIRKEYWGSLQLTIAFGDLIVKAINDNPDKTFYWMLNPKGARTFKFLPVYFIDYYPNHKTPTPQHIKKIIDALGYYLYPEQYDSEHGVIRALPRGQYLRKEFQQSEVTNNIAVNSFYSMNPGYIKGDELVCLTRLSFDNIRPFIKKFQDKFVSKGKD
jgi:hypothetical protein